MKKQVFLMVSILIWIIQISIAQELEVSITDMSFDRYSKKFYVNYEIPYANDDELYLVEFDYAEFFNYRIVKPVEGSIYGDAGPYAVRGGRNKQFIWDFKKQNQTSLEVGEFRIDITQLQNEVSKRHTTRHFEKLIHIHL